MSDAALVLLGHGSRDPEGVAEFLALAAAVQRALPALAVEAGVLEFAGPDAPAIDAAFARCIARGARRVLALPALLHFGIHGTTDMPAVVEAARRRYPQVEIRLAPPLSGHENLFTLVAARCAAAEARLARGAGRLFPARMAGENTPVPAETAVLLVGRGSTCPRANADLRTFAQRFQQRSAYRAVEVCFVSLAPPSVPAGLRRCVALGARRVLVIPYFVNTGLLVRRIAYQVALTHLFYPALEVAVAPHLGVDALLVTALLDRARETWPELLASGHGRDSALSPAGSVFPQADGQ
jgi:sirohydrochlorin ferrochelatase